MSTPRVSVVIASGAGGEFLFHCLASLQAARQSQNAEVIVVDRIGEETRTRIAVEYPGVRVIPAPAVPRATVPQMRRIGAECASGRIVAIIEEHCTAPAGWLEATERAFDDRPVAAGGPILDANFTRLRDWVVYFSEYHNFMPPWRDGRRENLNGANIAYDRQLLLEHTDLLDSGYWEVVLHPKLAAAGEMKGVNAMGAVHTGPFDFGYYLKQRYLLSRVWGGTRREHSSAAVIAAHVFAAPIFPFLMLGRIAVRAFSSGSRLVRRFLLAAPLLFVAMYALTLGETMGYLFGPGSALQHVE